MITGSFTENFKSSNYYLSNFDMVNLWISISESGNFGSQYLSGNFGSQYPEKYIPHLFIFWKNGYLDEKLQFCSKI